MVRLARWLKTSTEKKPLSFNHINFDKNNFNTLITCKKISCYKCDSSCKWLSLLKKLKYFEIILNIFEFSWVWEIVESWLVYVNIVTRKNTVWKLARGCCLCYCKTFPLVPDSTECTKFFLPKSAVHYSYYLKSNNVIGPRKTTNIQKQFYLELISFI